MKDSASTIPRNLEARRRLEFFTNSLFMEMPVAKPVREMLSFRLRLFFINLFYSWIHWCFFLTNLASSSLSMCTCSVFTPYYSETVLYSMSELQKKNEDGISILFYLQKIYPGTSHFILLGFLFYSIPPLFDYVVVVMKCYLVIVNTNIFSSFWILVYVSFGEFDFSYLLNW